MRVRLGFAVAGLCAGLAGLVAHYVAPSSIYLLALSTASAFLGLATVVGAVLFARLRTRIGWAGCAASVLVVGWLVALQVPAYVAATVPANGSDLVVMTANLKVGAADPHALVHAARSRDVDVVMLEELTPDERGALRASGLDTTFPFSETDPRDFGAGTGLWSRFPLSQGDPP